VHLAQRAGSAQTGAGRYQNRHREAQEPGATSENQ
jgi:hypothetical protein